MLNLSLSNLWMFIGAAVFLALSLLVISIRRSRSFSFMNYHSPTLLERSWAAAVYVLGAFLFASSVLFFICGFLSGEDAKWILGLAAAPARVLLSLVGLSI